MKAKEETFLLVSLEEDKAKRLAQVISNDTCRRILDHLAKKKSTESELASDLGIPLSTVHYNLQHLLESRLVEAEEFHYSEKGKEVLHYSLSNKYVIIAPKTVSESMRDRLKSIIGAVLSVGFIGLAIQYSQRFFQGPYSGAREVMKAMPEEAPRLMATATQAAGSAAENAPTLMDEAAQAAPQAVSQGQTQPIFIWIILGAALCIMFYMLFEHIRKRMGKRK